MSPLARPVRPAHPERMLVPLTSSSSETVLDGTGALPLDFSVVRRRRVADAVMTLDLAPPAGMPLPQWSAGAHIDVDIPRTGLTRQYSLCGPPDADFLRIAVLREPESRGGSSWLHSNVAEGTTLRISGLRNHFSLTGEGPVVFVAGGIGITPIRAMIAEADSRGVPWELHYAGRCAESMAFLPELAESYGDRVTTYSPATRRLDVPGLLRGLTPGTSVYACGPVRLLSAIDDAAPAHTAVRTERFTAEDIDTSGDTAFEVTCARSGVRCTVPAGQSILATLRDAGIQQVSQCEEGVCGSCETTVLDGIPEHRDMLLTDEERAENTTMMICVSRAKTAQLTLDL
ncbi:PDR/VanB family oxidoreductase [Amycolatopsis rhabdoformis]|uniref:PDR/VanB family oxidoreductase n=1 Tax=Amycolatopsis rhabdoformis TaxID=1448059 RepID=A0ABZ1IBD0_9PSEU|nr:PDR/VanB family oxidoreductase [Amycolatopsis rhabdoformis]WSE31263.1 PDR/VanB family oxidoreductase [Amycolatopsis rhabdoformis]